MDFPSINAKHSHIDPDTHMHNLKRTREIEREREIEFQSAPHRKTF